MVSKLETESETRLVVYETATFKGEVNKLSHQITHRYQVLLHLLMECLCESNEKCLERLTSSVRNGFGASLSLTCMAHACCSVSETGGSFLPALA